MKVYVVVMGYSVFGFSMGEKPDYEVLCVCSTYELAESRGDAFLKEHPRICKEYNIKEYVLDDKVPL